MNESYEKLANAIVLQAVKDYRLALKRLAKHPRNREALYIKKEVEEFFWSGFYETLTTVDGGVLIQKLNEEVKV